jgi:deoxyribodipyrimidine photo-lyase
VLYQTAALQKNCALISLFVSAQISVQRIVLTLKRECGSKHSASVAAWVEEGVVRRELSDNFCFYNPRYDTLDGAAAWARDSLLKHESDPREHVYTLEQFEV